jgi:hypothetical protein
LPSFLAVARRAIRSSDGLFARDDPGIASAHPATRACQNCPRKSGNPQPQLLVADGIAAPASSPNRPSWSWVVDFRFKCQTAAGCALAFPRRRWRPGFASLAALEEMRAQGRPGARCTRGLVCNCAQGKRTRAYRYRRSIPAFPAQWLYGLLRALPGERLSCHRRPREASLLSDLMPAPRHQDHTTSPYARATHVSRSSRVHRIPPRVRDVRERPSHRVRRAEICG